MGKLEGKVALVTGASRGIGAAIATRLAAEGARVACVARTVGEGDHPLEGSLEATVAAIQEVGGEATAVACDVSIADNCAAAVEEVEATLGPVQVLVNNAALTYFIPIVDFPIAKWQRSMAVNVHAPFYLSRAVLPEMMRARSGAIVNISSAAAVGPGRGPYPNAGARGGTLYGAEKAALERFTQGLASEVYSHGISVTCVSPSQIVPTPGVVHHGLLAGRPPEDSEPPQTMAEAVLALTTEPLDRVTGRVTYSQEILLELGWIDEGRGWGIDKPGSGYSRM